MPLAIGLLGIVVLVTAIQGTYSQFFGQLNNDLTGAWQGVPFVTGNNQSPFIVWIGALLLIGLIGYIPGAQTISRSLLALVLLVIVLGNGKSAFPNFVNAFKTPPPAQTPQDVQATPLGDLPVKLNVAPGVGSSAPATTAGTVGAGAVLP